MSSREKLLLWLVGGSISVLLVSVVAKSVFTRFETISNSIVGVEADIASKKTTQQGMLSDNRYLSKSRQRSLSSDPDRAQTQYKAWLVELASRPGNPDRSSSAPLLSNFVISSGKYTPVADSHHRHTFRIVGTTDLERATRFLHALYSAPVLHSIQELNLTPTTGKELRLTASIQALGMMDAPVDATIGKEPPIDVLELASLEEYLQLILRRNLFGPPNRIPTFRGNSLISLQTGDPVRVTISADAAESDQDIASIEILKTDLPQVPMLEIGDNSAQFELQSDEETEYTVTVRIVDSGFPPKSAEREYTIRFQDPPPAPDPPTPPPAFDPAKLAFFSGTVQINDLVEAWIVRRESGKLLKLHVGDDIQIGSIDGVVDRITFKELEIDTPDGFLLIRQGQNLAEAVNLSAAAEALLEATEGSEEDDLR